jgi:hypothetical protein
MVTLCNLRRYTVLLRDLLKDQSLQFSNVSTEIAIWMNRVGDILAAHEKVLDEPCISDELRKQILDELGLAFCDYRQSVYHSGLTGSTKINRSDLDKLLTSSLNYLDHGIHANRRDDGLFHAYNLVSFDQTKNSLGINRLPEMLEGQVAVLSSGTLTAAEAVSTVQTLFESALYREDQQSFMLYPDRKLPGYLERNILPESKVLSIQLLTELLKAGDRSVIAMDVIGNYRFTGQPRNAGNISTALDRLADQPRWTLLVQTDRQAVLDLYESVVNHSAFTGRSGTMFGYEGLGCIYWHMVSKLLLAVQECYFDARTHHEPAAAMSALADLYYRIRQGLSFNKSVETYGAFPLDPYSHTPGHGGAQQPGMTGQVKEEILSRAGELGVRLHAGILSFEPTLLRPSEFLPAPLVWSYVDVNGIGREMTLRAHSLAFTVCQTPVVMLKGEKAEIVVQFVNGQSAVIAGSSLPSNISQSVLTRAGEILLLEVKVNCSKLVH